MNPVNFITPTLFPSCYIECEELCIDMFQLDPELIAGIMVVMTGVVDRCLAHAAVLCFHEESLEFIALNSLQLDSARNAIHCPCEYRLIVISFT